jgi:hypothetical protein
METNKKLQTPTSKHQRIFNHQTPMKPFGLIKPSDYPNPKSGSNSALRYWMLKFGVSPDVGAWSLELS